MKKFTKFLKLSFGMVLVSFLCETIYAQVDVICQSATGCILEIPENSGDLLSLYVLAVDDCTIVDTSDDGNFSADDLAGDYCYYMVSFSDGGTVDVTAAISTGCTDDLIALGDANIDVTVTEFCDVFVVPFECADFQVIHSAIGTCYPDYEYNVLLVMSGGNPGDGGYMITDDLTGESYGPIAGPAITFGPFPTNDGFSYTVSVVNNPSCSLTVSESSVYVHCIVCGSSGLYDVDIDIDPEASVHVLTLASGCSIVEVFYGSVVGYLVDIFYSSYLGGNYCYYSVSYPDDSGAEEEVSAALATGCVDDLIALGEADNDVMLTEYCDIVVNCDCSELDLIYDVVCSSPDSNGDYSYLVHLNVSGADSDANGYVIFDDQTGESYGPITGPFITLGPFAAGTGFSYTASVANNPVCSVTVSESIVDCITTEVDLLRFNALVIETGNQLNWVTATESNAKFFIVEHSINGVDFAQVGIIAATGFSNVSQDYGFLHSNTSNGMHYYRLKEVDVDENVRIFTETITVNRIGGLTINHVYPVPTENMVNVDFSTSIGETVVVRVIDIAGKVLDQQNYEAIGGMNNIVIDATPYAIGNYFLIISNGATTVVEKFVKN